MWTELAQRSVEFLQCVMAVNSLNGIHGEITDYAGVLNVVVLVIIFDARVNRVARLAPLRDS